uniref:Uncharacterized protein n=1 Tax=Schizophyllum commune (strain H4-8 / FGSC 9210) TaxID=578458 RepID=D8PWQ4_SCHCM
MTITAFAVLWDYGLLLMLLYNMRPGTPAFTVLSTVFNLLCAAFDIVCYNFMEIIEFFLSIPIAIVVGYLNIDPAAIKYDVLYVRNACSRAVRGYLVALRERARKSVVAAWHRGCGYLDYQWKLHCWYADNINAMIVGSIEGRIREFTNECITFIYLTPPLAEVYMAGWQAWFWLLWMRDGASLLLSYLPAFHAASSRSTSATAQSTPNASRSSTPVSDNEAPVSNSSQPTTPEPQASEPQPSAQDESPRTNPAAQRERAERRERRERKKREERAARKREADLRAARSKEERERRQLQERLAREAEERRLEQEEQERQRQMREQAAREEERQRKVQEQAALEKERQRKAQELAALEKERQRKAQEQAALEKARSQSTAGQWLKQAIAKAATEQKTQPQPVVPLASAGTASLQLPKTLPPVVLQKTTGPTLPFSLSAAPVMAANPPRTPTTASTQPPSQSTPQPQAPILQQRPAMNLQPRLGQGQNVPQQLRPQPQQSAVGTPAGSLASPSGLQAFPTFFASGTAQQRPATGLPFPISTSTSAPAAPVTLAPPASAPPSQPQPQQQRTPEEIRLTVLARIAALKQEAQQLQTPSQTQQQPQQPSTQLPMLYAQPTPTPTVAAPSAASGQPTLFPANTLQVTPSSNQTATHNDAFSGAAVGSSMPAFSSSITSIHPINIPEPQAVAEPMEIDIPMPFIHNPSPPPQSDLMDVDDIEMEDAWEADCSATLSSDILPLSAPPTMEVDDELPESWPSPVWFPLATPQPSRPVTPAPLSPPPAVVRSPEIVMEVVAAPQNAPAPPPVATPPKPSPPRQVTTPTTFSVPLKPTSTAASASSSVPSTNGTTPKPAQGPSASTPPKATSNVSKQPAIPAKPTDPSKAPAPAPAAPKAGPSSIPQSSAPAKPSSVTPPASQANSPLSSPPAASRVDAGSAKAPANTSTAKPPLRKFGFALTKRPTEKKEETEDKPILFKDKRQFPPDAKKPAGPSVASYEYPATCFIDFNADLS